jgi:hypothetical protein
VLHVTPMDENRVSACDGTATIAQVCTQAGDWSELDATATRGRHQCHGSPPGWAARHAGFLCDLSSACVDLPPCRHAPTRSPSRPASPAQAPQGCGTNPGRPVGGRRSDATILRDDAAFIPQYHRLIIPPRRSYMIPGRLSLLRHVQRVLVPACCVRSNQKCQNRGLCHPISEPAYCES